MSYAESYMLTARIIGFMGIGMCVLAFVLMLYVQCKIRELKRERHRLDRALNRYNRAFNDDYDYFNGFGM